MSRPLRRVQQMVIHLCHLSLSHCVMRLRVGSFLKQVTIVYTHIFSQHDLISEEVSSGLLGSNVVISRATGKYARLVVLSPF